jgi:hypothetical protein
MTVAYGRLRVLSSLLHLRRAHCCRTERSPFLSQPAVRPRRVVRVAGRALLAAAACSWMRSWLWSTPRLWSGCCQEASASACSPAAPAEGPRQPGPPCLRFLCSPADLCAGIAATWCACKRRQLRTRCYRQHSPPAPPDCRPGCCRPLCAVPRTRIRRCSQHAGRCRGGDCARARRPPALPAAAARRRRERSAGGARSGGRRRAWPTAR